MPGVFNPPIQPHWESEEAHAWATDQDPFEGGYVQTRARWPHEKRRWRLVWPVADKDTRDYIVGFLQRQQGAARAFSWLLPVDMLYQPKPALAPGIWSFAGGAKALRTYYVRFTWANASGETEASPEDSITVPANSLLRVEVPDFPAGVTQANVYVGTVSGTTYLQSTAITTSGGTWDEPTGALDTVTPPPASSTLADTVTVHLEADSLHEPLIGVDVWSIELTLVELFR